MAHREVPFSVAGKVGVDITRGQKLQDSIPQKLHPLVAAPVRDSDTVMQ